MIVDIAIYVEGRRVSTTGSVSETSKKCRDVKGVAWIELYQATEE